MTKLEAWKAWCASAGALDLCNRFSLEQSSHGKAFSFAWERGFVDGMQRQMQSSVEKAVAAGDAVLMNEQASLLRECRAALDSLIAQKPTLAGLVCGSTTLGNLKAELHAYRPQGVFGSAQSIKEKNI
jgi:hypothetical protein